MLANWSNFRHYVDDIFNSLLDMGLSIQRVHEAPYMQQQQPEEQAGNWEHERSYVAGEFAIIAKKE